MGERTEENRMKQYDVICPICGTENKGLYLEETHGWMTCEKCHQESLSYSFLTKRMVRVPILTLEQLSRLKKAERSASDF